MRVLLLGAGGQLGSDLMARGSERSGDVSLVAVGRETLDASDGEAAAERLRDLEFDAVINAIAYHKTDEVEANAQLAFAVNAHFVRRLAELCGEKGARLLHVSTDYVFGGQDKREPLQETDGKSPLNVYGASKGIGEDLALQSGADVTILRVASLFGVAGASGKGGNFVETMIRLARQNGVLRVVDDQIMSPTSTRDIAAVVLDLLRSPVAPGIYHAVSSGPPVSWCGFAHEIVRAAGIPVEVIPVTTADMPTRAKRPPYSALSNRKLAGLGFDVPDWQAGLRDYVALKGHI
jgi:dTDP-4-dehydrorhamnose reductase